MEKREELITVTKMRDILNKEIEKGHGDYYVFINEYFVGEGECYSDNFNTIGFEEIHVQDVIDYEDRTGDAIISTKMSEE